MDTIDLSGDRIGRGLRTAAVRHMDEISARLQPKHFDCDMKRAADTAGPIAHAAGMAP